MPWTFEATRLGYAKMWLSAAIKPGRDDANAESFANKIIAAEARYRAVQSTTGVPWFFTGSLHMREASCSFAGVLHNGEPIIGTGRRTTKVPTGVGPFATWEDSAVDVLHRQGLDQVRDWPIERMLYSAEKFNGLGYVGKIDSPYVWAGTNHEDLGKFDSDGHFNSTLDDTQIGVAAVLKRLAEKRPDIAAALVHSTMQSAPAQDGEILPPAIPGTPAQLDLGRILSVLLPMLQYVISDPKLRNIILPLVFQILGVKPDAKPAEPAKPPASINPVTQGSLLTAVGALLAGSAAQLNGNIAPPIGETATLPGIITSLAPIAIAAFGGPAGKVVSGLFGAFVSWAANRKPS